EFSSKTNQPTVRVNDLGSSTDSATDSSSPHPTAGEVWLNMPIRVFAVDEHDGGTRSPSAVACMSDKAMTVLSRLGRATESFLPAVAWRLPRSHVTGC